MKYNQLVYMPSNETFYHYQSTDGGDYILANVETGNCGHYPQAVVETELACCYCLSCTNQATGLLKCGPVGIVPACDSCRNFYQGASK